MKRWIGPLALLGEPLELVLGGVLGGAALPAADAALGEQVLGEQPGLDGLGELDLGDRVEQRGARDLVEVHADAVASLDLTRCGASRCHGACRPFLWGQGHTQRYDLVFTTTTNACSRFPSSPVVHPCRRVAVELVAVRTTTTDARSCRPGADISGTSQGADDRSRPESSSQASENARSRQALCRPLTPPCPADISVLSRMSSLRPGRDGRAQPGHPLGRLDVEHPGVVERGLGQDRRVALAVDVLVGRVGLHVGVDLGVLERVAPLVPLDDGERQGRVEDRGQRVDERHLGDDRRRTRPGAGLATAPISRPPALPPSADEPVRRRPAGRRPGAGRRRRSR